MWTARVVLLILTWGCVGPLAVATNMPKGLACSACYIVARKYGKAMAATEGNEETIQTGHRLDKDNKIPRKKWKESELRAMEVTESMCKASGYKGYVIGQQDAKQYFTTNDGEKSEDPDAADRDAPKMLESWCSELLGEHEEDIWALARKQATPTPSPIPRPYPNPQSYS